ncbi:DUF2971 domain-containing protein [Aeromonas hydrophila]|uniref:DUF2971 domain-containing protein n=1 Tax=Aeromonas hydrophila TaxID=644 RepID=UPI002B45CBBE|nr:DUF2971 domain-containing protein [Aeromonas hydrophila]
MSHKNEILYKYYSKLPLSYFDKPNLKISPPETLNDPFESVIPEYLKSLTIKDTREKYELDLTKDGKPRDNSSAQLLNEMEYLGMLRSIGVISLSETSRNLLMWAHYANNHQGFCIGYDSKLIGNEDSEDERLPISTSPVKIKYNNCRFDFTNISININESHHEKLKSILLHILTTKSDEWIYEKEYRIILPLRNCDEVYYLGKDSSIQKQINEIQPRNYKKSYTFISNEPDFMFAKNISKKDIKSIHFGCRIDPIIENEILNKVLNDDEYKHVMLYKYKTNSNRFELDNQCFNYALREKNPLAQ